MRRGLRARAHPGQHGALRLVIRVAIAGTIVATLGAPVAIGASPTPGTAGDAPATTLRLTLGRLLAEHAYLTMEGMRAAALEAPERDAVLDALGRNTDALSEAIGSVYGPPSGEGFRASWQTHVDALLAFADARANGDTEALATAERELASFRTDFAALLRSLNPRLSGDAEAEALQMHLDQMTAYVDGDYARAVTAGRAAYSHMFELGDHLAREIATQFPDRFPGRQVAFSPKAELRVALGRLLGEHLVLSAESMRAGLGSAPDAAGMQDALAANTADLSAAVGRIYGAPAGSAFSDVWTRHVDAYLRYIESTKADDAAGQEASLASLHGYHMDIAEFLAGANPRFDRAAIEALIQRHVEALIAQVDAYHAGDYARSVTVVGEAYDHMFEVGDALAEGIAAQFPDRFTDVRQLPPTSTTPQERDALVVPALLLVLLGALVVILVDRPRVRTGARR